MHQILSTLVSASLIPHHTPSDFVCIILEYPIIHEWPIVITPEVIAIFVFSLCAGYILSKNTSIAAISAIFNYICIYVIGTFLGFLFSLLFLGFGP
jgi:hypothetical protein